MGVLLDYSAAKLAGRVIKGAGYDGVIRYIDEPARLGTKHTNKAEYDDHLANGLKVYLVYEVNTDDPLGGFAGGQAAARRALAGADYLGYKGPIFFCADRWFNATGKTLITPEVWRAYLQGAASIVGIERTGAYGFSDAMDAGKGYASFYWQCGSKSALRSWAHLWQDNNVQPLVGGIRTDRNEELLSIRVEEEDMPLNATDLAKLHDQVWYGPVYTPDPDNAPTVQLNAAQVLWQINAAIAALAAALEAATGDSNITAEAVRKIIEDAVKENLRITGTVEITGAPTAQ